MSIAPEMATGVPKPAAPLDESAEAETDKEQLDSAVIRNSGDRILDHLEITCFHRDVVHEDRAKDDPSDRQEPEGRAVSSRSEGYLRRHSIH